MEKIGYIVLGIGLAGLVAMGLGGWMIHTALNAADIYKTIFGFVILAVGGWCSAIGLGGIALNR